MSAGVTRRPVVRALAAGALGLGVLLLAGTPAAADWDDRVTAYDEHIVLDADGVAHVSIDLTMDFGSSANHGPELAYQAVARYDDTFDRVFAFSDVTASSETAPADVDAEGDGDNLRIRIGDPDTEITGTHSYHLTFDVDGWVNPADYPFPAGALDHDELNLNVFVDQHAPLDAVTVTLEAPADVLETTCFAGPYGSTQACTSASSSGAGATWTQAGLPDGEGLTVAAAFPAGTFTTEPILREFWSPWRAFALTPATGGVATLVAVGGAGLAVGRVRRTGRDRAWLGLTPGLEPAPGQDGAQGFRARTPVSVQFAPPVGLHPGQLGTLVDEQADVRDVTASIVDLAVRGYLTIEAVVPEETGGWRLRKAERDWTLRRTDKPDADLVGYEQKLLASLFDGRHEVALSDLRTTFAESLSEVQTLLYADVTERGWFAGNPRSVRNRWVGAGLTLAMLGGGLVVLVAAKTHWGLAALPLPLVGLLVAALARWAPARTATGSAVLAQTEGFRRYLATAEADQLRFEEGEDLFSRYLPYAIAFGLTERWTRLFAQLAAQGAALSAPSWYVGPWGHAYFWANVGSFGDDISSFTSITDAAMSAPQPGSSGGSGFSSGGGFSGGGLGGGSIGSW